MNRVGAEITVRYWAGAQRAANTAEETLSAATIADLRALLAARVGFDRLAGVVSFLVDGQHAGDALPLHDGAVVDVLPPFAGG
ncbi:MAG: MoaD/ThiS family protein [Jatrophihabitantaceae bacterium]